MSRAEFDKVQFVSDDQLSDAPNTDSEAESAVTVETNEADSLYEVDAIRHAVWRDSSRPGPGQRPDGWKGWHYKVMWRGYLKSLSETEEPVTVFETPTYFDEDLGKEVDDPEYTRDGDMVVQFWKAFDTRLVPQLKLRPNQREPGDPGRELRGHVFHCPNEQMRKWINDTAGKRTYGTWLNRKLWEQHHPDELTIKRYSDYYVYKARMRRDRAERQLIVGGSDALKPKKPKKIGKEEKKDRSPTKEKERGKGKVKDKAQDKLGAKPVHSDTIIATKSHKPISTGKPKPNSVNSGSTAESAKTQPAKISKKRKFQVESDEESLREPDNQDDTHVASKISNAKSVSLSIPAPGQSTTILKSALPVASAAIAEDEQMDADSIAVDRALRRSQSGSSLGSDFDSDREEDASSKAPKPFPVTVPAKTTAKPAPSADSEALAALFPSPPRKMVPGEMAAKLGGLGKIKKRDQDAVPASINLRAATPHFGEPDTEIFGPPTPAPTSRAVSSLPAPAVKVLPPTPIPTKPKTAVRPPAPAPAKTNNLLKSTLAALSAQAKNSPANPHSPEPEITEVPFSSSSARLPSPLVEDPPKPTTSAGVADIPERPRYQQPVKVKMINGFPAQRRLGATPGASTSSNDATFGSKGKRSPHQGGQSPLQSASTSYQGQPVRAASSAYVPREPRSIPTQPQAFPHSGGFYPAPHNASHQHPSLPLRPAFSPVPSYDPRLAGVPPTQAYNQSPAVPAVLNSYNPSGDPRLNTSTGVSKPLTPVGIPGFVSTPIAHGNKSPRAPYIASPRSPGGETRKTSISSTSVVHESMCQISATLDSITFEVGLLRGASLGTTALIRPFLLPAADGKQKSLVFEEVDDICLKGSMNCGARMVEWARATVIGNGRAGKPEWEHLRVRSSREQKAFVTYTELRGQSGISAHYALVLAAPGSVDMSDTGLGQWQYDEIKFAVFVIELPLGSGSKNAPRLPNPVRPNLGEPALYDPVDQKPNVLPQTTSLLDSYGLAHDFLATLRNRTVYKYPGSEGPIDVLHDSVVEGFKMAGVRAIEGADLPENMLVTNQKFTKTLRSSTVRAILSRRTPIYAFGPSLQLYPEQWTRQKIWQTGGLVTFSPTFILRSPDKFAEIMTTIRTVDTWAAYMLPSVIEWCHGSWSEPARCPEPTKAFEALSKSLFLDENLLRLSGSLGPSGGGLAVSCAPPVIHNSEGCRRWMEWLRKVTDERKFESLAGLCFGVQPRDFARPAGSTKSRELDLIDIEQTQMEDLSAMRGRPHLLPYRRYLYIGEVSLDPKTKSKYETEIELVAPENFAAIISGAV